MKPINEFTETDVIRVDNEQELKEIQEMLSEYDMQLTDYHCDIAVNIGFPFVISPVERKWQRVDMIEKGGRFTIHPASDYIIKPGDEVVVRDTESIAWATGLKYIGKTSKERLVVEDKNGNVSIWDLIRKSPKAKAIAEIKKIAEENGIDLKEI
jgi:hypothetical protein